jgi:hypothetical protein
LQFIYNYFTTSLTNIIFNYSIHPFDEWVLFLYFITYLQLFYNLFNNIFFHHFIHLFDVNGFYPNPLQLITTILQLVWWIYSFIFHSSIWQMDSKYPYLLQLIYNYFINSLTNIFFDYFIHPFEQWNLFLSFATSLQLNMKWK